MWARLLRRAALSGELKTDDGEPPCEFASSCSEKPAAPNFAPSSTIT